MFQCVCWVEEQMWAALDTVLVSEEALANCQRIFAVTNNKGVYLFTNHASDVLTHMPMPCEHLHLALHASVHALCSYS